MQLVNDSPFEAIFQMADLLEPSLPAVVIVKSTFDLSPGGALSPSREPMPFVLDRLETPFGEIHGELFFKKEGADICVLGTVRRREPVLQTTVRLAVGDRQHVLSVTGDRVWVPRNRMDDLVPSRPNPFTEMPLSYHYAFGGAVVYNGAPTGWADNPIGMGYYLEPKQAEGNKLPNIEDPTAPARRWDDRPKVAGWAPYPMYWGLRAIPNVQVDPERYSVEQVRPGVFNHAHPDLVLDQIVPGTGVRIQGLGEQPIEFRIPKPPAHVAVTIGARTFDVAAPIDGVFVWADASKLVVTQRARFEYTFVHEEIRRAVVTPSRS